MMSDRAKYWAPVDLENFFLDLLKVEVVGWRPGNREKQERIYIELIFRGERLVRVMDVQKLGGEGWVEKVQ
jgi:hypothetical protein